MKAIHDRHYATPAATFAELRWRMQHIAEEYVGVRVRSAQAAEDAQAAEVARNVND